MTLRPWVLAELPWPTVKEGAYDLAVLPWGATEAHNTHLPYQSDTVMAESVAIEAARLAWERGARPVVLPSIPFGVQTGQREIPLCVNLSPSTQALMLRDIAESVLDAGIGKLLVLHGHGGNDLKQAIRELQGSHDLLIAQAYWYRAVDPRPYFDPPGDHAGALETSVMMHLRPEQVAPLEQAGPGAARRPVVKAFAEGWAWMPRRWVDVTDDTGDGDPRSATREAGERYFRAVTEALAGFFVELGQADRERLYD